MLIFIPSHDLSVNADEAETIDEIDLGFIQVGESKTASFRIGNRGGALLTSTVTIDDLWSSLSLGVICLGADEISDTITVAVAPPVDSPSSGRVATIAATDAELTITYTVVGPFDERSSQFPERSSDFTDNVSSTIGRVGEVFTLHRYDPIPHDPDDDRVFVSVRDGYRWTNSEGRNYRFSHAANPCDRLDPLNGDWGYAHSSSTIIASFQLESFSIRENSSASNTAMSFDAEARLTIPAEYDVVRAWALFSESQGADSDQYKRTVFLIQRQSRLWALHNIFSRYRGNELSHHICDLIPLHNRTMGSADFYNPFAFTFAENADKPYSCFPCDYDLMSLTEVIDGSGSGAWLYNTS